MVNFSANFSCIILLLCLELYIKWHIKKGKKGLNIICTYPKRIDVYFVKGFIMKCNSKYNNTTQLLQDPFSHKNQLLCTLE